MASEDDDARIRRSKPIAPEVAPRHTARISKLSPESNPIASEVSTRHIARRSKFFYDTQREDGAWNSEEVLTRDDPQVDANLQVGGRTQDDLQVNDLQVADLQVDPRTASLQVGGWKESDLQVDSQEIDTTHEKTSNDGKTSRNAKKSRFKKASRNKKGIRSCVKPLVGGSAEGSPRNSGDEKTFHEKTSSVVMTSCDEINSCVEQPSTSRDLAYWAEYWRRIAHAAG